MKPFLLFLLLLVFGQVSAQQKVLVPENVYFADMHLRLTREAQTEIQKYVDYLLAYPSFFQQKVDRADTYFPIIERIFKEEGLPEDFKYLVLQESGLVSDAVSTSNAVGFWQFKKEAASDFGLSVSTDIDERKHIVESSRGAAKYLKKHNHYYNNWVVTLLSYNLGFTGVKSTPEARHAGKNTMPIEKGTHIYIQKFLAHKIAFENFVGKNPQPALNLQEYEVRGGGSLHDIAQATKVDIVELERYNKWLLGSTIPNNKTYTVLLPITQYQQPVMASSAPISPQPTITTPLVVGKPGTFVTLNGLRAIVAGASDTKDKLALQAGITTRRFLRYNDMRTFDPIHEGQPYFVEDKKTSASVEYYIAQPNESLQSIAQKHGMKEKSIRMKNRMDKNEVLVAGRKLWMQKTRPRHTPAEYERQNTADTPARKPLVAQRQPKPTEPAPVAAVVAAPAKAEPVATQAVQPASAAEPKQLYGNLYASKPGSARQAEPVETIVSITEGTIPEPETESETPDTSDDRTPFDLSSLDEPQASAAPAMPEPVAVIKPAPVKAEPKPAAPVAAPAAAAPKPAAVTPKPAPAVPASAPAPAPVAAAPAKATGLHTVEKGETLYSISKRYGLTPAELQSMNKLTSNSISIGQHLQVAAPAAVAVVAEPAKPAAPAPAAAVAAPAKVSGQTHTVQPGETMYQIARRFNVTVIDLMEMNNRTDTNLKPGETLVVKKG